ncbi:probable serine carboxypeptidase CPVL isoform X2 [Ornithorhynchus anatinus]|uniref:Probable serine carboxypeptidase CPVL n=1 Tax=Ornithorhynchus anatinus TaxID=9258 RepID=F7D0S5_ORNAN|nr:probable serine carboxypeptidase CPVL isoform X2 [Ornithorhynchus anatinus]XP_028926064.1 probable serine carboxypeptidase CPVL isoform X2 [Ornithorhynchus anatinus]
MGRIFKMWKVALLLALLSPNLTLKHSCAQSHLGFFRFLHKYSPTCMSSEGDPGHPLFLTPYIKNGKILEGRDLSLVDPIPGANVKSYSGYLTVNETYNSNLFFWFFPAQIQPENAPVVLWLQGGPGGSSMFGLFVEHGPYIVNKNLTLCDRDFSWTSKFSMIYIDNPVGTGFSFTTDNRGYAVNQDDVARDLYSALTQFFQLFPEYQKNDFYATGESYAGKYVPAISHFIHTHNPTAKLKINLKGIAIGDGFSDPASLIGGYADFMYQIGLLDEKQREYFQKQCDEILKHIKKGNWIKAFEIFDSLLNGDQQSVPSFFQNATGCSNYFNFLQCQEPEEDSYFMKFLSLPEVRKAIHVGNLTFNDGAEVEKHLLEDVMKSVKPCLVDIMNNYRVLIYSGQLDIIVAAPLTEHFLTTVEWKGTQEYLKANKNIWKIQLSDTEVAGYVRQVNDFHQVIVRGGGHILPSDQPARTFDMMNRFIFNKGWCS